jgi:hypothetical protein
MALLVVNPMAGGEYVLDADCSDAVMQQRQNDELWVTASRVLNAAKWNYCASRRNLSNWKGAQSAHFWSEAVPPLLFIIDWFYTTRVDDSKSTIPHYTSLTRNYDPVGQSVHWMAFLADYRSPFVSHAGTSRAGVDGMSLRPCEWDSVEGIVVRIRWNDASACLLRMYWKRSFGIMRSVLRGKC